MKLSNYHKKRRFQRTPEPRGRVAKRPGRLYVIQKHAASHLHYDFRLEHHGVLLSWALPKGPSLDPSEKRLAVHVEDHPVDYGAFEGTIPKGEYGGGTVMLWDRGHWEPHGDADAGYRAGKLSFTLHGEKLHGDWTLVRMGKANQDRKKENWLLLKARDSFARSPRTDSLLDKQSLSVKTGRTLEEIASGTSAPRRHTEKPKQSVSRRGKHARLARHPLAQLAVLVDAPPEGDRWLHEMKFDGYRMFAVVEQGKVTFRSRNDQDWTHRLSSLTDAVAELPVEQALFDGEVVVLDEKGISRFQLLQNALGRTPGTAALIYYVFDLLHLDGRDLSTLPLEERKQELRKVIPRETTKSRVRFSDHVVGNGDKAYHSACRAHLEGIISKLRDAPYRPGRGGEWVKCKCQQEQEFVIGGYSEPQGARSGFGSLLLGYYDRRRGLKYAGRVGTGFNDETLKQLTPQLKRLEQSASPFDGEPRPDRLRGVHWVKPTLVAQVHFAQWTDDGLLRQPSFQGLREDKPASKVVRERVVAHPRRQRGDK